MKKTNLKQGDKVFNWWLQEWETVENIDDSHVYPIKTDNTTYTIEGKMFKHEKFPTLSLTKWNPVEGTGVFTAIDSEPQPQIGDMVWAWHLEWGMVNVGRYISRDDSNRQFRIELENEKFAWFNHISLTPPEWILKHINKYKNESNKLH